MMISIYDKQKVSHHICTPHHPQENAVVEQFNRKLMESVRALLHTVQLPLEYWEDAVRDTIFKYNVLHHSSFSMSPYHLWYGHKPHLPCMFTFGQRGMIPIYAPKKEMDHRAEPEQYMYVTSLNTAMALNIQTQQYQHIRTLDVHTYHNSTDPTIPHLQTFRMKTTPLTFYIHHPRRAPTLHLSTGPKIPRRSSLESGTIRTTTQHRPMP